MHGTKYTAEDAEKIIECLSSGIWKKSHKITSQTGVGGRKIRSFSSSTGYIIGSSTQGYKLTTAATDKELWHHIKSLESRLNAISGHIAAVNNHIEKMNLSGVGR